MKVFQFCEDEGMFTVIFCQRRVIAWNLSAAIALTLPFMNLHKKRNFIYIYIYIKDYELNYI